MDWTLFWTLLWQVTLAISLGGLPVVVFIYLLVSVVRLGLSTQNIEREPRYHRGTTIPRSTPIYSTESTK